MTIQPNELNYHTDVVRFHPPYSSSCINNKSVTARHDRTKCISAGIAIVTRVCERSKKNISYM